MHILVIHQWHRQQGRGGAARHNELAAHWTAQGCQVTVLTTTVDHQSGQIPPEYAGRVLTEERADGARVLRVFTLALDKTVPAGRITRDLSFACASGIAGLAKVARPDVVVASSPPLFDALPGMALARYWRVPLVFEARDLWPDLAVEYGVLKGASAKMAYALEAAAYKASRKIVVVTPAFKERLLEKGVPEEKLVVIPNGIDPELFYPGGDEAALRESLEWEGKFVVLYAGVHGPSQALSQVIQAAALLRERPGIKFVFVGEGDEKAKLQALSSELGLANIEFRPPVPREQVPHLLRAADAGLSTLKSLPSFARTYPAKVFEILGCGRPIILGADGAVANLVREAGGGVVAPAERPEMLARAVATLHDDRDRAKSMGASGAAFVAKHYDRRVLATRYLEVLRESSPAFQLEQDFRPLQGASER